MIDFLLANIESVGTALVAVILLVYALVTRQWLLVRSSALSLMLAAERLLTTEQGKLKMEWVFREVQKNIPVWMRPYLTDAKLRDVLQEIYDNAKKMLD